MLYINCIFNLKKNKKEKSENFFRHKTAQIKALLTYSKTNVACFKDDPNVIVGYECHTNDHLDFIYVKPDFRRQGIAKLLLPKNIKTYTSLVTNIGKLIADQKNLTLKENAYD